MKPAPPVMKIRLPSSMHGEAYVRASAEPEPVPARGPPPARTPRPERHPGGRACASSPNRSRSQSGLGPTSSGSSAGSRPASSPSTRASYAGSPGGCPSSTTARRRGGTCERDRDAAAEPAMSLVDEIELESVCLPGSSGARTETGTTALAPGGRSCGSGVRSASGRPSVGEPDLGQAVAAVRPGLGAEVRHAHVEAAHLARRPRPSRAGSIGPGRRSRAAAAAPTPRRSPPASPTAAPARRRRDRRRPRSIRSTSGRSSSAGTGATDGSRDSGT